MDFFQQYFQYVGDTECPVLFHRWAAISGIGAILGRNYSLHHGHFTIHPNIYGMIIGNPGTRKSTAIRMMKHLVSAAGYDKIAADKTTKEKFLIDISGEACEEYLGGAGTNGRSRAKSMEILDANLWGDTDDEISSRAAAECYIMADEWNDFTSLGNIEFYSLLGTLWDYEGVYKNRIKNGKSVSVNNPTISILGGNTPTGFAAAFPTEIIGQGFFSRLILIYGDSTGKKITFPKKPSADAMQEIVYRLQEIRAKCQGLVTLEPAAASLLEKIYTTFQGFEDVRFESYFTRRFTHLLKLCLICAASRVSRVVQEQDVIMANTILTHTEYLMPKALGEFGKAKDSDIIHKVMQLLEGATKPLTLQELHALTIQDTGKQSVLTDILSSLRAAEKVQFIDGGFLPKKKLRVEVSGDTLDFTLLTREERMAI